jgi:adenine-specific DNA methylase
MEHPGEVPPSHLKASWVSSRKCLFGILEELVLWENTTNEAVLEKARAEIRKSLREVCELNQVLPEALDDMTRGSGNDRSPVAPVDLSQAIIGPGMAVFSKYAAVLEADWTPMSVRTALQLINRFLAEDDFDADPQFCLHWFEQYGWKEGAFGIADILARAKDTSVDGVRQTGVLYASGGVVRLLRWGEYSLRYFRSSK